MTNVIVHRVVIVFCFFFVKGLLSISASVSIFES